MADMYLIALAVLLLGILVNGLVKPVRFYEYPYFMTAAFTVFVFPQAVSLRAFPGAASPAAVEAVFLMTLLCAIACVLGYRVRAYRWIVVHSQLPVDDRRLFHFGVLFTLAGFVFTYLIGQMSVEQRGGSMWTGRVTIYLFFASLMYPGFSICLRHALHKGSATAWIWTAAGAVIPVVSVLRYGRREPAILFAVTVAMTLFFQKRWTPPRSAAIAAVLLTMVAIPATTEFRMAGATNSGIIERVSSIDFVGNFQRFLSGSSILELRNAAMAIDATASVGNYEWGAAYWDQLVFRFVPAQIFGREFKESLMFSTPDVRQRQQLAASGYKANVGSTVTGMGDSFQQFGYAGALFFALLAVVFKSLWQASLQRDSVFAQLLYIQTSTAAMRAITHQTVDYLPGLVYNLIFLGLAAMYARKPAVPAPRRTISALAR